MAKYVDGFVLAVPDNKVAEYTKMSGFLLLYLNQKSIATR